MPTDATTDQTVAELQRQLATSRQTTSRLENELSASQRELEKARAAAAAAEEKAKASAKAAAAAEAKLRQKPPPPSPPAPAPPPPPPSLSPGLKKAAAEAEARAAKAEAAAKDAKSQITDLRAQIKQLEAELANKPDPGSRDRNAAALQRVRFDLERTKTELEEERERRRSAERLLDDARKGNTGMRVPEPPPPKRGYTDSDREYDSAKEDERRRMIKELDGRLGKLEDQKLTHEQRLQKELRDAHSQIKTLQGQINRMPLAMLTKSAGGGNSGLRAASDSVPDGGGGYKSPRSVGLAAIAAEGGAALRHKQRSARNHGNNTTGPSPSPREVVQMATSAMHGTTTGGASSSRPTTPRGAEAGGAGGMRDRTAPDRASILTEEERQQRLSELDPVAAQMVKARRGEIDSLRKRLVNAQAQRAAEISREGVMGDDFEATHSRAALTVDLS